MKQTCLNTHFVHAKKRFSYFKLKQKKRWNWEVRGFISQVHLFTVVFFFSHFIFEKTKKNKKIFKKITSRDSPASAYVFTSGESELIIIFLFLTTIVSHDFFSKQKKIISYSINVEIYFLFILKRGEFKFDGL